MQNFDAVFVLYAPTKDALNTIRMTGSYTFISDIVAYETDLTISDDDSYPSKYSLTRTFKTPGFVVLAR